MSRAWRDVTGVLAAGVVASAGCSSAGGGSGNIIVRDSAGVRIVTSHAPHYGGADTWRLAEVPSVEIGASETDTTQQLHNVVAALRLSDGRIVIVNGTSPYLRWFDGSGTHLYSAGRSGQGPGEFAGPEGASIRAAWLLPGDSLAIYEGTRRTQVFASDGKHARSVSLQIPQDLGYPQFVAAFAFAGALFFLAPPDREALPLREVQRPSQRYVRFNADGTFAREVAVRPGFMIFGNEYMGRRSNGRPPFSRPPVAAAHGDDFFYGSADNFEIERFGADGQLRMIIRRAEADRRITSEMIEALKQEQMAAAPADPAVRVAWRRSIDAAPYPDSLPAYRRMRTDRAGNLWVQEYDVPTVPTATWSVFDRDGEWLSNVTVPRAVTLLDIDDDHVLLLARDALDVQRVRQYDLQKPRAHVASQAEERK